MAGNKSRTYAWVQLLANLPEGWEQMLSDMVMPACYIVHDKDEAQPHVHVMVDYNSPVMATSVLQDIPAGFHVGHVEPVRNRTAYQRYMLHHGEYDKHRYEVSDMKLLYGCRFNMDEVMDVEFSDVYELIEEANVTSFSGLIDLCVKHYPHMTRYVINHTTAVKSYVADRARQLYGTAA